MMDKDVRRLSGADKKKIGIMMDQFGVYERLSCRDNLKIFAEIYDTPCERIDGVLKMVGLEDAADKPAMNLSKGMRARLQLARVFMHSPKLIFLDEPTSGLDPKTMKSIHKMITDKKNKGCTIFLTTHNMEEAAVLCDEVALLNEGRIVEKGRPDEICRKYDHQKKIRIHLSSGDDIELGYSDGSAEKITEMMKEGQIETIHSSEPNLESVFLELTGRKLEEDE